MAGILDLRDLADEMDELIEAESSTPDIEWNGSDEQWRLFCLRNLNNEFDDGMRSYADEIDSILIAESDFEEYARELADDLGMIDNSASWPMNCIDWSQAADELRVDYTSVTFDGIEWLIRS
jgi:hypothetical protein